MSKLRGGGRHGHQLQQPAATAMNQSWNHHHPHSNGNSNSSNHINNNNGPELLLTPVRELLSSRDESPVRRLSRPRSRDPDDGDDKDNDDDDVVDDPMRTALSLPICEILIIDTSGKPPQAAAPAPAQQQSQTSSSHQQRSLSGRLTIYITTLSLGFYEFQCLNRNGHDILMAFLRASVDPERIAEGNHHHPSNSFHPDLRSTSSVASSSCLDLDMDALHDKHFLKHQQYESWPEKMGRRVNKAISTLSELCAGSSSYLCDYATCCSHPASASPSVTKEEDDDERREDVPHGSTTSATAPPSLTSTLSPSLPSALSPYSKRTKDARKVMIQPPPVSSSQSQRQSSRSRPDVTFHYSDLELDDADSQSEQPTAVVNTTTTSTSSKQPPGTDAAATPFALLEAELNIPL